MTATRASDNTLSLIFVAGPVAMETQTLTAGQDYVLGRSSGCEIVLDDPNASISRKHLRLTYAKGSWAAQDLGSRNGSMLNTTVMEPERLLPIKHGDSLAIGPWVFRALLNATPAEIIADHPTLVHTLLDTGETRQTVERVESAPLAGLASHRLAILLECSDQINRAQGLAQAAKIALDAMVRSTGFSRAAYLIPADGAGVYETIAFKSRNPLEDVSAVNFSQSLLELAGKGEAVRLSKAGHQADHGQSIVDLDIHSALCVPVMIDDRPVGFLYLDARGSEHTVGHDASAFGRAIGRLLGLTAANLRNKALEIEQLAMEYDLNAAASAQRMLLPPESGRVGAVEYCMTMRPGRMVAGDLFGIVELDKGRVCVFLGDVSGKGAGAAIMMATTQSYIHAMLEHTSDLSTVIGQLNRHIDQRSSGRFVTMWIGIITPADQGRGGRVEYIDAGHGHWLITSPGANAVRPDYEGGLVVGIDPGYKYAAESFTLSADQRLVLFSDGVVEQTCPDTDEEFGLGRTGELLRTSQSQAQDVNTLLESVLGFAQSSSLKDDTTIASIRVIDRVAPGE